MQIESGLPVLDECLLHGSIEQKRLFADQLITTCHQTGCFYLSYCSISTTLCNEVIAKAREFFILPLVDKSKIDIQLSPHFRGYSEMKNERDWREQVHFGLEEHAIDHKLSAHHYHKLQGPNLWLPQLGNSWRDTMLSFLEAVERLSQKILSSLAWSLGLPEKYFMALANKSPYLLMKLICYHPQRTHQRSHIGIAPHCDWSWMTFLLQDDVGGLQIRLPNGDWIDATPIPNTFIVNVGELLEILTCGYLKATPHRVLNQSSTRPRISVPVFVNPALAAHISPVRMPYQYYMSPQGLACIDYEHVHRVFNPSGQMQSFVFGDSEWRRKGQGYWCYNKACYGSESK